LLDNEHGIKYTGPWAAYFFLNLIGLLLLGMAVNWLFPMGLALFGINISGRSWVIKLLSFILSMPVSYFFFHLAVSTYLVPQIAEKAPNHEINRTEDTSAT